MNDTKNKVEEPVELYGEHYTYGDYLKFNFDYMVELIRGKIFKMSPAPGATHQVVAGKLNTVFDLYFRGKTCHSFIAPFDVVLPVPNKKKKNRQTTVVQPDLCVICDMSKIDEAGCHGAPDLMVEIISTHTSKKDVQLKYEVYEEAGVREYWIVFPKEKMVEIFLLENGKFKRVNMFSDEDIICPEIFPDLEVKLAEVFDYGFLEKK